MFDGFLYYIVIPLFKISHIIPKNNWMINCLFRGSLIFFFAIINSYARFLLIFWLTFWLSEFGFYYTNLLQFLLYLVRYLVKLIKIGSCILWLMFAVWVIFVHFVSDNIFHFLWLLLICKSKFNCIRTILKHYYIITFL